MRPFPLAFWQHATDMGGVTRFSLDTSQAETSGDEDSALESLRCDVILELSNRLTQASLDYPHLAPFLMDGLDNALEHLQLLSQERDLQPIQQWLRQE